MTVELILRTDRDRLLIRERRVNDIVDPYEESDVYGEEMTDYTHEIEKRLIELIAYTPKDPEELSKIIESAKQEFANHLLYATKNGIRQTLTHLCMHDDISFRIIDESDRNP